MVCEKKSAVAQVGIIAAALSRVGILTHGMTLKHPQCNSAATSSLEQSK